MDDRLPGIRPRPSLWRRLDMSARRGFPAATTALLLLVTAAPLGLPGQAELLVAVALSCVFFWSLFRPASLPPPVVFLLGVLWDLLGYAPPGVGVLILLVVHGLALRWRRFLVRQGFLLVWLVFVGIATGAAAVEWALSSLLIFRVLPPAPAAFQAALTAGLYPPLAVLLTRAHQTLAEPGLS
ncbi:rod shape-determining protein MreD [Limobrevibacterium gyesilva]|uniref:Rod shape-determining protein MreD n=1 Tax=Limobrevibacterium gyesilva TaxID=2991712 RepID=A0AA41YQL0_9PROT|nr:rod shape-determining protein MreD [Limobrevibacterium gyesilva]MCW3474818.1 rod shape-determining protein MreD [Limobrevibacterium gyesilva]